jgi:hypothetical protein
MWRFDAIQKTIKKSKEEEEYTMVNLSAFFDKTTINCFFYGTYRRKYFSKTWIIFTLFFLVLLNEASMTIEKFRSLIIVNYDEDLKLSDFKSLLNSHEVKRRTENA